MNAVHKSFELRPHPYVSQRMFFVRRPRPQVEDHRTHHRRTRDPAAGGICVGHKIIEDRAEHLAAGPFGLAHARPHMLVRFRYVTRYQPREPLGQIRIDRAQ